MADLLIVDDDVDISWLLEQLLALEGHTLRIASDGAAGLRLLQERAPDMVLLDVDMPVLDGPAMAYRMFVHNVGLENIPIVLLSACHDLDAIAARVGTPYAMAKPFDSRQLMTLLARALAERQLPRPSV
jgi:DNA-binding NtrC family response regulator